ncbi:hypothetical protein RYH80_14470 [Halobaculum sp. MBLA0147]|uniref:hypothetical protein n=1 Tax=Halobaculum sp. MBLA0147 TaxID=3079934 RepID=UPI00352449B8
MQSRAASDPTTVLLLLMTLVGAVLLLYLTLSVLGNAQTAIDDLFGAAVVAITTTRPHTRDDGDQSPRRNSPASA